MKRRPPGATAWDVALVVTVVILFAMLAFVLG